MTRPRLIASYPKSGSTWVRLLLGNLLDEDPSRQALDKAVGGIIASVAEFERCFGYNPAAFSHEQIDALRVEMHAALARPPDGGRFYKVHDAYLRAGSDEALFPPQMEALALYVVRNPLDVCVSLRHHMGHADYDETVAFMADERAALGGSEQGRGRQLRQWLGSWSSHVHGWRTSAGPLEVVRYEDLLADTAGALAAIASFLDIPAAGDRIERAVESSRFSTLQAQERAGGYRSNPRSTQPFFRAGETESWRRHLSARHVDAIVRRHGAMMAQLGYLPA